MNAGPLVVERGQFKRFDRLTSGGRCAGASRSGEHTLCLHLIMVFFKIERPAHFRLPANDTHKTKTVSAHFFPSTSNTDASTNLWMVLYGPNEIAFFKYNIVYISLHPRGIRRANSKFIQE